MSVQYGVFAGIIAQLDSELSEVMAVWNDKTASTYGALNVNIRGCAQKIWAHHNNSEEGYNVVKANYNESDFNNTLNQLSAKIDAV